MFKILVMTIALLFATPAIAQFDGAPSNQIDRHYQDLEQNWQLNLFIKGSDLDGCNVTKEWSAHPEIKRLTKAENVSLMIVSSNGVQNYMFVVTSLQWNIVNDKEYKIQFMFDENKKVFDLNGLGFNENNRPSVGAIVNREFVIEFARAGNIAIWINEVAAGMYPLAGSRNAVNHLFRCDEQFPSKKGSTF